MVATDSLTPELEALWQRRSDQQRAVQALCAAAAAGDVAGAEAALAQHPGLLSGGVFDVLTGAGLRNRGASWLHLNVTCAASRSTWCLCTEARAAVFPLVLILAFNQAPRRCTWRRCTASCRCWSCCSAMAQAPRRRTATG